MKFEDYHRLIAEVLIKKLKEVGNETITYGELSKEINGRIIPRGLGRPLGELNYLCLENKLPYISIIVHNQDNKSKIPSDRFFTEFFSKDELNSSDAITEIYKREIKRAIEFNNWFILLDKLPKC